MKTTGLLNIGLAAVMAMGISSCDRDNDVSASSVPEVVTNTFSEMFPGASDVDWEMNEQWYQADFKFNAYDTEAWFNADGTWAMTETEYDSMISMLPKEVYDAFTASEYSSWKADDATYYERPADSFCVIEVETAGSPDLTLFYDSTGNLVNIVQGDNLKINPATDPATIGY